MENSKNEESIFISNDKKSLIKSDIIQSDAVGNIQYGSISDKKEPIPINDKKQKEINGICEFMKTLTTEPLMFSFMFAYMLNVSTLANLIMDKGCRFYFNHTDEVCKNLTAYPHVKDSVEILANNYALYNNLLGLIAAVTMIFIAPWSDKYGRKLPIFLAFVGVILSDVGLLLCTIHFDSNLVYLVLAKIPSEIFGGFICILTILYCHASETTSEKYRTVKYMTLQIGLALGMSLGGLAGGLIYRYYGYFYVYLCGLIVHSICIPWILFVMQETKAPKENISWAKKINDFFSCENLVSGWKVSVRKRENNQRLLILLLFASMCIIVLMYESFGSVNFIYVHHLYSWDPARYNIINTAFSLSQLVIVLVLTPLLSRVYKVSDYTLGLLGTISLIAKNTTIGFAYCGEIVFYLGNGLGQLNTFCPLAVRSGISKIVDKEELGRVFSFLATCEQVVPMLGTVVITKVFNATLNINPSITYLMTAVALLLPLGTFTWAYVGQKKNKGQGTETVIKVAA